jgi:hypothetical protein
MHYSGRLTNPPNLLQPVSKRLQWLQSWLIVKHTLLHPHHTLISSHQPKFLKHSYLSDPPPPDHQQQPTSTKMMPSAAG